MQTITRQHVHELRAFRTIFIYGAGEKGQKLLELLQKEHLGDQFTGFVVSDQSSGGSALPVASIAQQVMNDEAAVVIIASYATMEMAQKLNELGISRFLVFEDQPFDVERCWRNTAACQELYAKLGQTITSLGALAGGLSITLFLDGYPHSSPDAEQRLRAEVERETGGTVLGTMYTDEIGKTAPPDSVAESNALLLHPVYSNTLEGTLKALDLVARLAPGKKLTIHEHERLPMRRCVVLDKQKLIYMPMPKCGSTSILTALRRAYGEESLESGHADGGLDSTYKSINVADAKYDGYFKFTNTRNPFNRIVSLYKTNTQSRYMLSLLRKRENESTTFAEFCAFVASSPDHLSEPHYRSQFACTHHGGQPLFDYLGKLETTQETLDHVKAATGVEIPNLHLYHSNHAKPDYSRYFATAELRNLIHSRYRSDFEAFGYPSALP